MFVVFADAKEGNDVATNTKWILASNSLLVMPPPTVDSWLGESRLVPYEHYLPVKADFSDLAEVLLWAERNPRRCQEMVENAHAYMRQFMDPRRETFIESVVMYQFARLSEKWKAAAWQKEHGRSRLR